MSKRTYKICAVCLMVLVETWPASSRSQHGQEVPAEPLDGPVVLLSDDRLGGLDQPQFGVFRKDDESPKDQFIEEQLMEFTLPDSPHPVGFLALSYNVSGLGSYNGWWLRLGLADWEPYEQGELVLRLRQLDPATDQFQRSVVLDQPDTRCTDNFKLELKTRDDTGRVRTIGLRQRISKSHKREQAERGYFDLRVPLNLFSLKLDSVYELVIVFENNWFLPSQQRGALAIRGIALTTAKGQDIDAILRAEDN